MSGYSSRPGSARPQSRINPITGEEMPYSDWGSARTGKVQQQQQQLPQQQMQKQQPLQQKQWQQHQQQPQQRQGGPAPGYGYAPAANRPISIAETRPAAVPRLNLEQVIGVDEPSSYQILNKNINKNGRPGSPDTTISWGTNDSALKNNVNTQLVLEGQGTRPMVRPPAAPAPQVKLPSYRNNAGGMWATKAPGVQGGGRGGVPSARPGGVGVATQGYPAGSFPQGYSQNPPVERLKLEDLENEEQEQRREVEKEVEGEGEIEEAWKNDWTQAPYGKEAMRKISDKEELEQGKRKSKMLETVLLDQLNRPVMSDPMQTSSQSHRQTTYFQPGMKRGALRAMHDSKVHIDGTATENLLAKRVRFQARVLTACGRDVIRELTGFFFAADNSLTVYEFRQFGKTSKAMPFIKRGCYCRLEGSRTGQNFSLVDITPGRDLLFETANQPLPDNIKSRPHMILRISEVDNAAKRDILMEGVVGGRQQAEWERLHAPHTPEEQRKLSLLNSIQGEARKQINKRGIRVYSGLGRLLRQAVTQQNRLTGSASSTSDRRLNKFELEKSLVDFRIQLRQDMVDDLWEMLDVETSSFLNYDDFIRAYLGEMSEERKAYVLKAFMKLDPTKTGATLLSEMRKFYNVRKHPKVRSGECEEDEILEAFLSSFQDTEEKGKVSYKEFEEYYEGLSVCVNSDQDFINILKNTWNI